MHKIKEAETWMEVRKTLKSSYIKFWTSTIIWFYHHANKTTFVCSLLCHLASCEFMLPLSLRVQLHWVSSNPKFFSWQTWTSCYNHLGRNANEANVDEITEWLVKPLLLIDRANSKKLSILRLKVSPWQWMKILFLILKG